MLPQSIGQALRTEELVRQLDHACPTFAEDAKLTLGDLCATLGQVASVVGACGLLNILL